MAAEGCDIIDIGAESTRPGAVPVAEPEEFAGKKSVLTELADTREVPFSIDTYKSNVGARAVELGAVLVNDVWGLQKDPAMADAVAAAEAAVVVMHNRAENECINRYHRRYPAIFRALVRARREGRNCAFADCSRSRSWVREDGAPERRSHRPTR